MSRIWLSFLCLMCLLATLCPQREAKKVKVKRMKKVWSRVLQQDIQALQTNVSHIWKEMHEKQSQGVNIHVHGIEDEPEKDHMGDGTHVHIHMHLEDGGHGRGHGCGHHGDHDDDDFDTYYHHGNHNGHRDDDDDHHGHHDCHDDNDDHEDHGHHDGHDDHEDHGHHNGEGHEGHGHARSNRRTGPGQEKGKKDKHRHKTGDRKRGHCGHRDHHTHHPDHDKYMYGICNMAMNPTLKRSNHNIRGSVYLRQKAHGPVECLIKLKGFSIQGVGEGHDHEHHTHGFHVHAYGDGTNGCQSYGGHYNPDGLLHGSPGAEDRHAGDWGNISCDDKGVVNANLTDHDSHLWGPHSIIGRGIVIHEHKDDLGTKDTAASRATGDAGGRLACCVVAWSNDPDWSKLV